MVGHGLRSSIFKTQWFSPGAETGQVFDPDFMLQLKEYSSRRLTYEEDAIDAFRGILSTLDAPSYYGIPVWDSNKPVPRQVEIGFLYGLLWYADRRPESNNPEGKRKRFPSWSWASTPSPIGYLSSQMMFDATILEFSAKVHIEDQEGHLEDVETALADPRPEAQNTPQAHRIIRERSHYLVVKSYTTTWYVQDRANPHSEQGVLEKICTDRQNTGKYFDGYQALILPLASAQRSKEDTLILGCGSSTVNSIKTGKRLKAPFFGFTVIPAALRFSSPIDLLARRFNPTVLAVCIRKTRPQLYGFRGSSAGGNKQSRCLLLLRLQ
jgi:hypothetical protein